MDTATTPHDYALGDAVTIETPAYTHAKPAPSLARVCWEGHPVTRGTVVGHSPLSGCPWVLPPKRSDDNPDGVDYPQIVHPDYLTKEA